MPKYQKPNGFRFTNWREFKQFLSDEDIKNLECDEKKAKEEVNTPCPRCGGKVRHVDELSIFITRCIHCGFTRNHETIVTFDREEENLS